MDNDNNQFRPAERYLPNTAEFARLSSSMQLTLMVIRRAQQTSRRTLARLAAARSQQVDTED